VALKKAEERQKGAVNDINAYDTVPEDFLGSTGRRS
jgi:hypothetical protein